MQTILRNCAIVDCTGRPRLENGAIVIEGSRIQAIGAQQEIFPAGREPSSDARVVDLQGMTVMPGLMNLHVHLSLIYPVGAQPPGWRETIPWRMLKSAREALEAGVTLCRTTGEANHYDIGLRKAIDMGLATGPRLVCAGRGITPTGGHGSDSPWYIEADGADDFRKKAREELKAGADHIKLMVTGGIGAPAHLRGIPRLSFDEASAVCQVAHVAGKRVCAHNGGPEGAKLAVQAGVDCLEHCYTLDEESVEMMGEKKTFIVPTLCVTNSPDFMRQVGMPEARIRILNEEGERHLEWFYRAVRAGAIPAVGTDMLPTDRPNVPDFPIAQVWEMELMGRAGLSPMEVLQAATRNAAVVCQVEDRVGTLEPGKLADLIATPNDPSADLRALRDIRFVMKDGQVVSGRW
ncbi:MAG TPA: amidohydrolase family protein [Anaerolineae bacterium]|nr:amidohydrolase family protein [Anaerolineae bacterium]